MKPRWSVRHRLGWRLTFLMLVLVVAMVGLSVWFLGESVDRRLEELGAEELAEVRALFAESGRAREDFSRTVRDLGGMHPTTPLAWRVWGSDGSVWHEVGPQSLLDRAPATLRQAGTARYLGRGLFWCTGTLGPDRIVGVAVDGTSELGLVREHQLLIVAIGALLAALTVLSGVLFARHVSNLLRRVAESARAGGLLTDPTDEAAPEEVRDVAEAFAEMRGAIRAEIEHQRLMVAGLAHELRSPIQNLLGEAEVALLRPREAAEYRDVVESQVEELRDLARAVDNLVSLCASATPDARAELEDFDLGREAELRLDKEHSPAARRGVRLELTSSGDLRVQGDREALLLALRNLARNAIAWSPEGGTVRVTLEGRDVGIDVTVDDSGPGVPEEERSRIFEPFYRGRAARGSRVGYGLGLALTRMAVAAHSGSIVVQESPDGGARFRLHLPRKSPALEPPPRAPARSVG